MQNSERIWQLVDVRKDAVPFRVFGEQTARLLGPLRFGGGLVSRRLERGLADEAAAGLSDGSTFLLVTSCGAGRIGVLNTDLLAGNLPASPAFVPLVNELAARLIGGGAVLEGFVIGDAATFPLPPNAGPSSGLRIEGPGDDLGRLADEASGAVWRCGANSVPGVYRIKRGEQTVFAAAATLAPEEADLTALEPDLLRGRLAGQRQVFVRSARDHDRDADHAWIWLAIACLTCLIGEVVALAYYRT